MNNKDSCKLHNQGILLCQYCIDLRKVSLLISYYCSSSPEQEQASLMLVQEVTLGSLSAMGAGVRHSQVNRYKRNYTVQQNIL